MKKKLYKKQKFDCKKEYMNVKNCSNLNFTI